MHITFFNNLSGRLEPFSPLIDGEVSMYVCGPTVYNDVHIGNIRPVVVFDTLARFLSYVGYNVKYVSNYTDIDDKIINRAQLLGISEQQLAEQYIAAYDQVRHDINALKPTHTPRVTEYLPAIIEFIATLVERGYAYENDGDVYFAVNKISEYGKLANVNIDDLIVGARVEENSKKRFPLDFTLWKKTEVGVKWPSPWGEGRPGWHTECVVMIDTLFPKKYIDIHGGGFDLKFPHHDNEIAQSLALNNNEIARFWLHNGFINIDNEKMSKSLGNTVLAKDIIAKHGGNLVRLLLLSTHYRAPVNFTDDVFDNVKIELTKIENVVRQAALMVQENNVAEANVDQQLINPFITALADDLNTSNALAALYQTGKELNQLMRQRQIDYSRLASYFNTLLQMLNILGIIINYHRLTDEDRQLLSQYRAAKSARDFTLSDELRNQLVERNIL